MIMVFITLFRFLTELFGTESIPRNNPYIWSEYGEYSMGYSKSHITPLWI